MHTFIPYTSQSKRLSFEEASRELVGNYSRFAGHQLRELLEDKHLYQKVSFQPQEFVDSVKPRLSTAIDQMEHVEVPKFIPKSEARLYRDAVIASNSGKSLAGLFYLRSFIEQFARRVVGFDGKVTGSEIMDAYSGGLPTAQRDSMPSLGEWYEKLSAPIHAAADDSETFTAALERINKHFEIRKVFGMPEKPAKPSPTDKE